MAFDAPEITLFQSTLSVRRATGQSIGWLLSKAISIHALRKESDPTICCAVEVKPISIHALRKESDPWLTARRCACRFQSTLSVRRATVQLDIFVHFLRRKPAAWL